MRQTHRLLAAVKPAGARYLVPGDPTGLTGLRANPSPRATLLFLYRSTLDKLAPIPETSVYRQSVEAVTKHRMAAVESVKPAGFDEWAARAKEKLEKMKRSDAELGGRDIGDDTMQQVGEQGFAMKYGNAAFVIRPDEPKIDERYAEWDGQGGAEWAQYNATLAAREKMHAVSRAMERVNAKFGKKELATSDHHDLTLKSYLEDLKKAGVEAKDMEERKKMFFEVLKEEEAKVQEAKSEVWEDDPQWTIDQ